MTAATQAHPPGLDGRTLVRELTHRIKNQLTSVIDVVTAAAVRADHSEAKVALANIADLLQEQANVHRALSIPEGNALIDAAQYLSRLRQAIARSNLEPIGLRLSIQASMLLLEPERCWRLGMAVHELVINAAQHTCFEGQAEEIKIRLSLAHTGGNCVVANKGSLSTRLKPAQGLGLVRDLIKSLSGRLEYRFGPKDSCFLLAFPLTEREQRANRIIALRRAKTPRRLKAIDPLCNSTATARRPKCEIAPPSLGTPTPASIAP